jgi:hypothetical protein
LITQDGRDVHIFERTMSDALLRHIAEHEPDGEVIDLWRLLTPMRRRQAKKYPALPPIDCTAPLCERMHQDDQRIRQLNGRRRINDSIRGVKFTKFTSEDTFVEYYSLQRLGVAKSGEVATEKFWEIFDAIARESGRRKNEI